MHAVSMSLLSIVNKFTYCLTTLSIFFLAIATFFTAQKMKFFFKDFFSKYDQIRRKLRIWSHLHKKSLMENFIFCAVYHLP